MNSLKCLYVHDHTFKTNNQSYFSEGKITDAVFSRYVNASDSLTVFSRISHTTSFESLNRISLDNIQFSPVKGSGFSHIFSKYFFQNITLALSEIRKSDFIVVRLPSFLGVFILLINLYFKKKFFIELVGDAKEALLTSKDKTNIFFNIFISLFTVLNTFFVKRADGVIYVTEFALQQRYPTSALKSYASNVEVSIIDKALDFQLYRNKNNYFKIGLIGSFNNSYKGIDDAIRALDLLTQNKHNVSLHILGSGTLKANYLALAKELNLSDKIFFDGVLSGGNEVNEWLDCLDLYIQPSRTEGLPRALIEAMARGLPAIASEVGGVPELLASNFLIEAKSYQQLAEKIEKFIGSPELRYEQGIINYNKAREYDSAVLRERRAIFWQQARDIVQQAQK